MQDSNSKQTAQRPEVAVLHWSQIPNRSTKTWFFSLDYLHTFWGQCTSATVRLVLTRATSSISNRWYEGFVFSLSCLHSETVEKKNLWFTWKKAHWTIDDCSCIYEQNSHIVLAFWTFEVEYKLSTHSTTFVSSKMMQTYTSSQRWLVFEVCNYYLIMFLIAQQTVGIF